MTTTRWKPRGRIGLRPRRKTSGDPARDDAQPEFRALDETPSHRSPGFDEAADKGLIALADEIDTRRDPLGSAADRRGENARRLSTANPSTDRQGTTERDADQLPAKPEDKSPRRPANSSSDGHERATTSAPAPEAEFVSHDRVSDASTNRHKTATGEGKLHSAEIAGRHSTATTNGRRLPPVSGDAEPPRSEANSDHASRRSLANPDHARHEVPRDADLSPAKPAVAARPRATTDPAAGPSHDQTPVATTTKHPVPPGVADNRLNREGRTTRRREMGSHAAWYLAAGVVTTGLQAVLFLAFRPEIGAQWANLAALAITTVGNTEFHRRVTFANRSSRAGKRHLQDLVTFAFYAGYGSVVLAALDAVVPHPSAGQQTAVLLAASFVGGVIRFAVLRWWVFARARRTDAAQDHQR